MTLSQLRCFVEVAKHLSFARAGEALYISQPAVSNQIHALEDELGIKLFERSRHSVSLTAAGASLYPEAAKMLDHFSLAVQRAKNIHSHFNEELRIGYLRSLRVSQLPMIYQQYQKSHAHVHILNVALETPVWNPSSDKNSLDIVFCNQQQFPCNGLVQYQTVHDGKMVCVLHQSHPLARKKSLSFSDLGNETFILLDTLHCTPHLETVQRQIQITCPNATFYFSSSAEHTLPMIQGQIGIAVIPDCAFDLLPSLVAIPIEPLIPVEYGIAWKTDHNERKIQEFVKITCEQYGVKVPKF